MKISVLYKGSETKWTAACFEAPIQNGQDIAAQVAMYWTQYSDADRPTTYLGLEIEDFEKARDFVCHYAAGKRSRLFKIDVLGQAEEIKIPANINKTMRLGEAWAKKTFGEDEQ